MGLRKEAAVEERAEHFLTALIVCADRGDGRRISLEREARIGAKRLWCGVEMKNSWR